LYIKCIHNIYHNNIEFEMRHLSLHFDLSIIENFESMQTINNKRKYTNYNICSKCCPLVLTHAWSHFLHWSVALSTMISWKSAQNLTTRGFSSGRVLASCIPRIPAPAWCCCCHKNRAAGTRPISSFSNTVNPQYSLKNYS